jgi:uncharacterized phiE125 gp8 family phage protein
MVTPCATSVRLPVTWAVTTPPTEAQEPLTLAEVKLRAGLDWIDGDPRDALMRDFLAAARAYVEQRTDRALAEQTIDAWYDGVASGTILVLPGRARPLQAVMAITSIDAAGGEHVLDPARYQVDAARGLVYLGDPLPTDTRAYQPWRVTVTAGLPVAQMPPGLVQCVGVLTAHEATAGRDVAALANGFAVVPFGFDLLIAPFEPVVLA